MPPDFRFLTKALFSLLAAIVICIIAVVVYFGIILLWYILLAVICIAVLTIGILAIVDMDNPFKRKRKPPVA